MLGLIEVARDKCVVRGVICTDSYYHYITSIVIRPEGFDGIT